jgi:hypothetical protein
MFSIRKLMYSMLKSFSLITASFGRQYRGVGSGDSSGILLKRKKKFWLGDWY